jgi:hypothetical protein
MALSPIAAPVVSPKSPSRSALPPQDFSAFVVTDDRFTGFGGAGEIASMLTGQLADGSKIVVTIEEGGAGSVHRTAFVSGLDGGGRRPLTRGEAEALGARVQALDADSCEGMPEGMCEITGLGAFNMYLMGAFME